MAIHVCSPTAPSFSPRLSKENINTINESAAPSYSQPFLSSPSPTETVFRQDSPVLPRIERNLSGSTYCISPVEGAYPSPLLQRTFLHSPSEESFDSLASTAVDLPSPRPVGTMSDRLPDQANSNAQDENYLTGWNVATPGEQPRSEADTEALHMNPGLELPAIGDDDFPYYPETPELPHTRPVEKEEEGRLNSRRSRWNDKRGSRIFGLGNFVRRVLVKFRIKRQGGLLE